MIYIADWIGSYIDETMYNCYLFGVSVYDVSTTKFAEFLGFEDYYTSFLYNLLAESLQIRAYALELTTYQEE
jgi:hypothetical protein